MSYKLLKWGTGSFTESWECVEKQNLSFSLPGFFQLPEQSSAPAQTMVFRGATTATPLMGSRRTRWGVDLASPEPEPKDLLLWSGACQFSLSLESHSRFIHGDVHCRGTETHILLTTEAQQLWLAAQQPLLSSGSGTWHENGPTEKQGHSWALCWRML